MLVLQQAIQIIFKLESWVDCLQYSYPSGNFRFCLSVFTRVLTYQILGVAKKWQFILTTHCLGKHLSNEECWNENRLLYLSLHQLQTSWLRVQILVTVSILIKKKSSTQIIVNSVAWRVEWHYMCLKIIIFLPCPKIHRATLEASSLVAITLGLRADQPHCKMNEAKPLKSHVLWILENLVELN